VPDNQHRRVGEQGMLRLRVQGRRREQSRGREDRKTKKAVRLMCFHNECHAEFSVSHAPGGSKQHSDKFAEAARSLCFAQSPAAKVLKFI
jgi:hypothetical protein